MRLILLLVVALCTFSTSSPVLAQSSKERPGLQKLNLDKRSLAIDGYDPVAYFPEGGGKALEGMKALTVTHRGAVYRFANTANRDRFLAGPERFEPAFGGWCAWAMADDDRVGIDPESFLIQDGELLLFYDGWLADTRKKWRKGDVAKLKTEAGSYWRKHFVHADRDLTRRSLTDGLALSGYDPIAYLGETGMAQLGSDKISYEYRGVTYRFATTENRDSFRKDPARYEPRVGGWDPMALIEGAQVAGTPERFVVHDAKLYLFASDEARAAFLEAAQTSADRAGAAFRKL
tara:strand:+ start:116 stop:985 length:870 start_codon:yes stop_codon:yes gene_type:complete